MKLFGRGRSDTPQVRLRRTVDKTGRPATHRIAALVRLFGHADVTPDAVRQVEADLASVGLTTHPALSEVDEEALIDVLPMGGFVSGGAGLPTVAEALADAEPDAAPAPEPEALEPEPEVPEAEPDAPVEDVEPEGTRALEFSEATALEAQLVALREDLDEARSHHMTEASELEAARESQVSALRDEHESRLAEEQRARQEAEARAARAEDEIESKSAQLTDAERRIDEAFEERLAAILESQETVRKERERADGELRQAEAERARLQAEASAAERRATEAETLLEDLRAELGEERQRLAGRPDPLRRPFASRPSAPAPPVEPPAADPAPDVEVAPEPDPVDPPVPEPVSAPEEVPDAPPSEPRTPAFLQPPAKSPSRRSLPKLRGRRRGRGTPLVCAVTGIPAPTESEWELRRQGWIVNDGHALSPEAQADGWQFPEGATLPFRKLSQR